MHYNDVIINTIASQITSLTSVYSTVYSGKDHRNYQSSASLAFVWGIHRGTGEFPAQKASNAENVPISWRHYGKDIQVVLRPFSLLYIEAFMTWKYFPHYFPGHHKAPQALSSICRQLIWALFEHAFLKKAADTKFYYLIMFVCVAEANKFLRCSVTGPLLVGTIITCRFPTKGSFNVFLLLAITSCWTNSHQLVIQDTMMLM